MEREGREIHMHEITTNNHDNINTPHHTDTQTHRHTHLHTHACTRIHAHSDTRICTPHIRTHTIKFTHLRTCALTYERTPAHTTLMCGMRNEGGKGGKPSANTRARAHTSRKTQPRNGAKRQESEGDMKIERSLPECRLHAALADGGQVLPH